MSDLVFSKDYSEFLYNLKDRIRQARVRAALATNEELTLLYWQVGRDILQCQEELGWGSKVVKQLAKDLRQEFPDITGFSSRNLNYMRAFAKAYPDRAIVQQLVAQIPWGHNVALLTKLSGVEERLWYARKTIDNGWSRNVLISRVTMKTSKGFANRQRWQTSRGIILC